MLSTSFEGIRIVDLSMRRQVDRRFQEDTVAALNLIKSLDPRRFRRIQREIHYIVNTERLSWAGYARPLRECEVDYPRIEPIEHQEWSR